MNEMLNSDEILLPTQRFTFIDLMEALAIVFVVIYHCGTCPKNVLLNPSFIYFFNYFLTGILSVCVPVFFLCNGFLLFGKPFNLKKHLRKIGLLLLVLFFWRLAIPAILIPLLGQQFNMIEFLKIAWNYKIGWNNQLWFLETLICIYVVFPLLKFTFEKSFIVFSLFLSICALFTLGNTLLDQLATIARSALTNNTELVSFNFFKGFNPFAGIKGYAFVYFCAGGDSQKVQSD